MNSITDLLDLEDANISISSIDIEGQTKTIYLEAAPEAHFCPCCGFRMHSMGTKNRKINHPILQDNYKLVLILKQRRWRCTNPDCLYDISDSFKFVSKRFHVSDTYAHDVFDRYVKLDRLPLTDAISVDEVFLDMDDNCKYALVIQDFHTGNPIDLLRSRRANVTEPYFTSIPPEERNSVKYLISDMYNPYIPYVDKYFPYAVPVVDSFHVLQWITRSIDNYMRQLLKKYKQRDRERQEQLTTDPMHPVQLPISDEVYILQKYRWIIL